MIQKKRNSEETALVAEIMDYCDAHDIDYIRIHPVHLFTGSGGRVGFGKVRPSQKGAPDLIVFVDDRSIACECKSSDGELSGDQIRWRERWTSRGRGHIMPRTMAEFLKMLEAVWH